MTRYLCQRLLQSLVVLLVMSAAIYALIGLMPGDPVDLMITADPNLTPEDVAHLRALYGLDQPLIERYGHWLRSTLSGDWGYSRLYARPVLEALWPALVNTTLLMASAFSLSIAIAIPTGMIAAARPFSFIDYTINSLAFIGVSMPPFWLALILIIVFAVTLGILPAGGTAMAVGSGLWHTASFLVLPVLTLTLANVGGQIRYVRAAMLDTLGQDYIRTARAKGLTERQVLVGHALRSAMIPVVTILALEFGTLFSGALITETVFSYPGMGKLIYDAILGNDYNLALLALLLATAVTLLANLLADIAYTLLDPRVSLTRLEP
ncbi:MAG: ABC transporter permease [Hyphomicrobiales bacterium]|nr:ABC transporter permease [Hyphomicrobiales bacterium]